MTNIMKLLQEFRNGMLVQTGSSDFIDLTISRDAFNLLTYEIVERCGGEWDKLPQGGKLPDFVLYDDNFRVSARKEANADV